MNYRRAGRLQLPDGRIPSVLRDRCLCGIRVTEFCCQWTGTGYCHTGNPKIDQVTQAKILTAEAKPMIKRLAPQFVAGAVVFVVSGT